MCLVRRWKLVRGSPVRGDQVAENPRNCREGSDLILPLQIALDISGPRVTKNSEMHGRTEGQMDRWTVDGLTDGRIRMRM